MTSIGGKIILVFLNCLVFLKQNEHSIFKERARLTAQLANTR